jgi:hypothetical protein
MKWETLDTRVWEKEFFGVAYEAEDEGSKRAQGYHRVRGAVWDVDAFYGTASGQGSFYHKLVDYFAWGFMSLVARWCR